MLGESLKRIVFFLLVLFIAWTSFVPEPWQVKWLLAIQLYLACLLGLSFINSAKGFRQYFLEQRNLAVWLYLFLISLNIWFAADRLHAVLFYRELAVTAICLYFIFKHEARDNQVKTILYTLVLCAAAVSLFGFIEMILRSNFLYRDYTPTFFYKRFIGNRMMSTLVHPNILGCYLLGCLPLAYYFYRNSAFRKKTFQGAILLLILGGIILTFSRGTWFALMGVFSLWLWYRGNRFGILLLWGCFLLFSFLVVLFPDKTYPLWRFEIGALRNYLIYGHRTQQYLVTFNMLKAHPFVGIGLEQYRALFSQYVNIKLPFEVMIPDSIYLMHLAETGIVGFFGLALMLHGVLSPAFKALREVKFGKFSLYHSILLSFTGVLINMVSFDGFLWRTPLYLFWIFAGILSGLERKAI